MDRGQRTEDRGQNCLRFNGVIDNGFCWEILTRERWSNPKCLERYGYKVYSQNDEDGIIEEIFRRIGTTNKRFIEFGVQNGLESNCHFLLFKNWTGLWIEGSKDFVKEIKIRFKPVIASKNLKIKNIFITRDNINNIIANEGFNGEIDILSIDIDGNDYHIWKAISVINPRVVIIEYNGKFPPSVEWVMAYNSKHIWDGSDNQGASLKSLELLGRILGYQLVGTNLNGSNAFFVRKDLALDKFLEPATAENLYNPLRKHLTFTNIHPARYCLINQHDELGLRNYYDDGQRILREKKFSNKNLITLLNKIGFHLRNG